MDIDLPVNRERINKEQMDYCKAIENNIIKILGPKKYEYFKKLGIHPNKVARFFSGMLKNDESVTEFFKMVGAMLGFEIIEMFEKKRVSIEVEKNVYSQGQFGGKTSIDIVAHVKRENSFPFKKYYPDNMHAEETVRLKPGVYIIEVKARRFIGFRGLNQLMQVKRNLPNEYRGKNICYNVIGVKDSVIPDDVYPQYQDAGVNIYLANISGVENALKVVNIEEKIKEVLGYTKQFGAYKVSDFLEHYSNKAEQKKVRIQ